MARRWRGVAAALAVAAVTVGACGGADGSDGVDGAGASAAKPDEGGAKPDTGEAAEAGAGAVDPCELITVADIEGVVGTGPVGDGHLTGEVCGWPVGEGADLGSVGVSVTDTTAYPRTAAEGVATMREGFGDAAVEIPGLGDEAVGDGAGMLAFRSDDWYVTVSVYVGQSVPGNQAAAEALAHIVLDRL